MGPAGQNDSGAWWTVCPGRQRVSGPGEHGVRQTGGPRALVGIALGRVSLGPDGQGAR